MTNEVRIEGDNLAAYFRECSKNIVTEMDKAILASCLVVQSRAKQTPDYVPVDTGLLRQSISHRVEDENGQPVGYVGTSVEYADAVENGTSKRAPVRFLARALDDSRSRIESIISKATDEVIK